MMAKIVSYLKASFLELKKVNWLSVKDAWQMTVMVILFSLTVAVILGLLDAAFVSLLIR